MLNVIRLSDLILCVILHIEFIPSVICSVAKLIVVTFCFFTPNVIMLSDVMLSVIMLSVVVLSVAAPPFSLQSRERGKSGASVIKLFGQVNFSRPSCLHYFQPGANVIKLFLSVNYRFL
jgi:hypothetical protein